MAKQGNADDRGTTVHARYEWASTPPSAAVIETVARASDRDPTTLGPLYEAVDPDALNTLIELGDPVSGDSETTISFIFADYEVTVRSGGDVVVRPDQNG